MINIVLVCAGGVSTSMLVMRMKKTAKERTLEVNIMATGADEFIDERIECDILLVAPQIAYQFETLKKEFGVKVKVIELIDKKDYGAMDGEKILLEVIEKLNKGEI